MDAAYISALAALAGSVIGGVTSFWSSWFGQKAQIRSQLVVAGRVRRSEVYRDFIAEASALYIDAMTRNTPDLTRMITLYALISRMRILSAPEVVDEAEKVARQIVELYPEKNKDFNDIRAMVQHRALDPLHSFAECCREELEEVA